MKKSILALCLVFAFALSLTACKVKDGGGTSGDNSTAGTSGTSTPEETQSGGDTDSTSKPTEKPVKYDEEKRAHVDEVIERTSRFYGIDVDSAITEAWNDTTYKKYYHKDLTLEWIRTASLYTLTDGSIENLTGVDDKVLEKVSNFLKDKGEKPLDVTNSKQNFIAFGIGASLIYEEEQGEDGWPGAFCMAAQIYDIGFSSFAERYYVLED